MDRDTARELSSRIIEMARQKKQLIVGLLRLSLEQSGVLAPEQSGELLDLIGKKQGLIDQITENDRQAAELEEEFRSLVRPSRGGGSKEPVSHRETLRLLWDEMITLVERIRQVDEENRRKAAAEHQKVKKEIQSLRARKGTALAYRGPAGPAGGYYLDKKK